MSDMHDGTNEAISGGGSFEPAPIMPMSNILTKAAAERIMSHRSDGGDDPILRSARIRRYIRKHMPPVIPKPMTRMLEVTATRAIAGTSKVADGLRDLHDVRHNGHRGEDVTMLGPAFLSRLVGMLGKVSDASSDGMLSDAVEVIRMATMWHADGYYEMASMLGYEMANETSIRVRREFDSAWDWLYDNVFATDPSGCRCLSWGAFWNAGNLASVHGGIGLAIGDRVRDAVAASNGSPTSEDLRVLPHGELGRLSRLLEEFAAVTQSWPESYGDRPMLSDGGDGWEDRQYWNLLGGMRFGDVQQSMEMVVGNGLGEEEQVFYQTKTNRQMGLEFAAWTSDCHEASKVLAFWAREKAHNEQVIMLRDLMTETQLDEIRRRQRQVWDWLGVYLFMMVC